MSCVEEDLEMLGELGRSVSSIVSVCFGCEDEVGLDDGPTFAHSHFTNLCPLSALWAAPGILIAFALPSIDARSAMHLDHKTTQEGTEKESLLQVEEDRDAEETITHKARCKVTRRFSPPKQQKTFL